jgi:hypothetical protein
MNYFQEFNNVFNKNLAWLHNDYIITLLVLLLFIYTISKVSPANSEKILEHMLFRFVVISYILYKTINNI